MKEYVKSLLPRLRQLNLKADAMAKMSNKPWTIVREDGKKEQLIFRQNGEMLMISGGQVIDATWDVIPEVGALVLNIEGKKSLYNSAFVDGSILLLKDYDGPSGTIMVNSDEVPAGEELWHISSAAGIPIADRVLSGSAGSTDSVGAVSQPIVNTYPREMFKRGLAAELEDGRVLRAAIKNKYVRYSQDENPTVIGAVIPDDGLYWGPDRVRCYDVKGGHLQMIYQLKQLVPTMDGDIRVYRQIIGGGPCPGCPVTLNHEPAPDGVYGKLFNNYRVKDGRVV